MFPFAVLCASAAASFAPTPLRPATPPLLCRRPSIAASPHIRLSASAALDPSDSDPPSGIRPLALKYVQGSATLSTVPCNADADGCLALCDDDADDDACTQPLVTVSLAQRLKVGVYFALWFALSVGYSVFNKRVTNVLPLPWLVATATVVVGSIFVCALWFVGAREPPRLPLRAYRALLPIGIFHAIGHIAGTVGTAAGSVSFAQVVKAAGPVYACVLSTLVLKEAASRRVWLSLAPIVGGVALATLKELSFAWAALGGAVVSDLALALRNVFSKQSFGALVDVDGEKISPAQMFGILTCISALVSLPAALLAEGSSLTGGAWQAAAAATRYGGAGLAAQISATGLFFYAYSEVAMKALANVNPVTHAIGNTLRRVIIMLVCMVAFNTKMTPLGALGSALAIGGSYLYAMTKHAEKQANQRAAAAEGDAHLVEKVRKATPLRMRSKKKAK